MLIGATQGQMAEEIARLELEAAALRGRDASRAEIAAGLRERGRAAEKDAERLAGEVDFLTSELADYREQAASDALAVATLRGEAARLRADVAALKGVNASLRAENAALREDRDRLRELMGTVVGHCRPITAEDPDEKAVGVAAHLDWGTYRAIESAAQGGAGEGTRP
jgi:chromosome segregation ATPase